MYGTKRKDAFKGVVSIRGVLGTTVDNSSILGAQVSQRNWENKRNKFFVHTRSHVPVLESRARSGSSVCGSKRSRQTSNSDSSIKLPSLDCYPTGISVTSIKIKSNMGQHDYISETITCIYVT